MADGDQDRAERLRRSRQRSQDSARSKTSKTEKTSTTETTSETETTSSRERPSLKEAYEAMHLYLPSKTKERLGTAYKRVDLELDIAGLDVEMEKNRHWYPIVIQAGLDSIAELDEEELAERIRELDDEVRDD